MSKIKKYGLFLVVGLLICQVYYCYNWIFPAFDIKVKAQVCTCPDFLVVEGLECLQKMLPDSLKSSPLECSEIFAKNCPFDQNAIFGGNEFWIKGKIIGKECIAEEECYPVFEINSWAETTSLPYFTLIARVGIFLELLFIGMTFLRVFKN